MSTRQELQALIAAASAPPPAAVDVPGLGQVWVRVLTPFDSAASRRALDAHGKQADGTPKDDGCDVGRLLATVLCDQAGAPLYEVGNGEDVLMLSKLARGVNEAIFTAHRKANGITTTEEAEALGKA